MLKTPSRSAPLIAVALLAGACSTPAGPLVRNSRRGTFDALLAPEAPAVEAEPELLVADEDGDDLLDFLLANGAITQEQYDQLRAKPDVVPVAAPSTSVDQGAGQPKLILDESGLSIRSADGKTRIDIGGRVQVDASAHSRNSQAGVDITDGTELRRARFELKGTFDEVWIWAAENDFANDATSVKDFWVGVKTDDGNRVMIGHQKQPYSLSVEMSSNDIPFVERGVNIALLAPFIDRAVGVRMDVPADDWFAAFGLFGESVSGNLVDDEGWGGAGRFVHAPVMEDDRIVHFGVRGAWRKPMSSTKSVRIRDETTNMSNFRVVNTGFIPDVDNTRLIGAEFAVVEGPFSVVGEIDQAQIQRGGPDYTFNSWSLETAYSLTGESRAKAYAIGSGEFKRLRPDKKARGMDVTSGGAWELSARLANLDANDNGLRGGEEDVATVEVNWYPNNFSRFMFGVSSILETHGGTAATNDADGLDIVYARAQLTF